MQIPTTKIMLQLLLISLLPFSCWASVGPDCGRPPRPPQQAFDACQNKTSGAAVEMTTPDGKTIKAVCREMGGELVAVPEGAPPPHDCGCKCQSEVPAEAYASK